MRRRAALAGISIVVLVGTACTASSGSGGGNLSSPTPTGSHAPVTLTLWTFYTNPEYPKYNQILDTFEQVRGFDLSSSDERGAGVAHARDPGPPTISAPTPPQPHPGTGGE